MKLQNSKPEQRRGLAYLIVALIIVISLGLWLEHRQRTPDASNPLPEEKTTDVVW